MAYFSDVSFIERYDSIYFEFRNKVLAIVESNNNIKITGSLPNSCFALVKSGRRVFIVSDLDFLLIDKSEFIILPSIKQLTRQFTNKLPNFYGNEPKISTKKITPNSDNFEDLIFQLTQMSNKLNEIYKPYDMKEIHSKIEKITYLYLVVKLFNHNITYSNTEKVYLIAKSLRNPSDVLKQRSHDSLLQYHEKHLKLYITNNIEKLIQFFKDFLEPSLLNQLNKYLMAITNESPNMFYMPPSNLDLLFSTHKYVNTTYPNTRLNNILEGIILKNNSCS